jgi:hypothetical protein
VTRPAIGPARSLDTVPLPSSLTNAQQFPATITATEAELSTGSLLFVAPNSSLCRQRTIDNSTWQIRDNGWVDCDEALAKSANSGTDARTQGSRLDLIREGFRGKQ